jgi:hypothetical protein
MSFFGYLFKRFGVSVENRRVNRHGIQQVDVSGLYDRELSVMGVTTGQSSGARAVSVGRSRNLGPGTVLRGPGDLIGDNSHLLR